MRAKIRPALFLGIVATLLMARIGCQAFGALGEMMNERAITLPDPTGLHERWQAVMMADRGESCNQVADYAARASATVPDQPEARYELTVYFYLDTGLGYGAGLSYGFGQGQIDFTAWEFRRGVLGKTSGSPWWRDVNGQLMRDMLEAHYLYTAGLADCGGSNMAVDAWLAFLLEPSSLNWYLAHNESIILGYRTHETLAFEEDFAEQVVMANTLYRVSLADFLVSNGQPLITRFSDPGGPAVDLITAISNFYPINYPLTLDDAEKAAMLYLLEGNTVEYADVNQQSVVNYLLRAGVPESDVIQMFPDKNLYQEMFPGFDPPVGRIVEP